MHGIADKLFLRCRLRDVNINAENLLSRVVAHR